MYQMLEETCDDHSLHGFINILKQDKDHSDVINILNDKGNNIICQNVRLTFDYLKCGSFNSSLKLADDKLVEINQSEIFYYKNRRIAVKTLRKPKTVRRDGTTVQRELSPPSKFTVYQGYEKLGEKKIPAAVKIIDKDDSKLQEREVDVWGRVKEEDSSPTKFIVTLLRIISTKETICIAMKLADTNLFQDIKYHLNPFRDRKQIIGYMKNVAEGLEWLHDHNILHRNIKPENVLIYKYPNEIVAKLGEFGTCRVISHADGSESYSRGSQEWMPPEALEASRRGKKFKNTKMGDSFAFAMLIHFSLTGGEHPFWGDINSYHLIMRKSHPNLLDTPSLLAAENILQWGMQKKPERRPTISQFRKHPFFWGHGESYDFLYEVASAASLKKAGSDWNVIVDQINTAYKTYYRSNNNQEFNWSEVDSIDQDFFKRKSGDTHLKNYLGDKLFKCAELVRDKEYHKPDMVDDLYKKFEDEKTGAFCKEKYMQYFHQIQPDMVIILFCALATIAPKYKNKKVKNAKGDAKKTMKTLSARFLNEFENCWMYWDDPCIKEFLSSFKIKK